VSKSSAAIFTKIPSLEYTGRMELQKPQSAVGWEYYEPWFWSPIPGHKVIMRRYLNGSWQYREMTPEEEHEYVSRNAW
jgi:hypothetical protein